MLLRRDLFLCEIVLCFFVEHKVIVVLADEALYLSILAVLELKEGEYFSEHRCVEGLELILFEGVVKFVDGVVSKFVVEIEVPI